MCEWSLVSTKAPTTGSQKCDKCGGWIVGAMSYIEKGMRYCPVCWASHQQEENVGGADA